MSRLKVIVVDDNAIFREGIQFYLEEVQEHDVIAVYKDGAEFLSSNSIHLADVVLMDIEMPQMNGILTTHKVLFHFPNLKVIAVTNYKSKAYLKELILAGFKGCVLKDDIYTEMEQALTQVMNGRLYFNETVRQSMNQSKKG